MIKPTQKIELLKKGWTEKEILKAERILKSTATREISFSKLVFATTLVVIIFANIIVSLVLIPFLVVFDSWLLYSLVIILAGLVGFLYTFLISNITHLEQKHHLLATLIIPLIAIVNLFVMVFVSNKYVLEMKGQLAQHNPWIISIVFALAFITPSIIEHIRLHIKAKKAVIL